MKRRRGKENTTEVGVRKYRDDFVRQVFYLSLMGAKDEEIAQCLGVTENTINRWKAEHPEFFKSMLKGKTRADARVAHSLYKRALGYRYKDHVVLTNRVKERNEKGKVVREYTEPLMVEVEKEMHPDVKAASLWLQARRPDEWGKKTKVEGKISVDHQIDLSQLSIDELKVVKKLGIVNGGEDNIEDIEFEEEDTE